MNVSLEATFQGFKPLVIAMTMWLLSSSIGSALPGLKVRFQSDRITRLQV